MANGLVLGEAVAGVQVNVVDIPYAAFGNAIRPPDDVRVLKSPRDGQAYNDVLFTDR